MIQKLNAKGFTLIELMIAVAIIGILTVIAIPNLLDAQDRAKQRATVGDLRAWGNAFGAFAQERSVFPTAGAGIADVHAQVVPFETGSLRTMDHWRNDFVYTTSAVRDTYTIRSAGKDGVVGLGVTPSTWQQFNLDIILNDGIFVNAPS